MRLVELEVHNFRSVRHCGPFTINALQAFVGENNAGKSNLLATVDVLTSTGAGGVTASDFNDPEAAIRIRGTFEELGPRERQLWGSYLVGGKLILEKQVVLERDGSRITVKGTFHGYRAEPSDWFLSLKKIEARHGSRPPWKDIVDENGLPEYFCADGKCNKSTFTKGLEQYLEQNEIEYDEPDMSGTQALGLASRVVASLPVVHLLKAITDYNSEIDRRSTTTTFRRLMGDLADRILSQDPKYQRVEEALNELRTLLNGDGDGANGRIEALPAVEGQMTGLLRRLMPGVEGVRMHVELDSLPDVFSRGVQLKIDDGVETEVTAKGHGLQRCMVYTLLQALILSQRQALLRAEADGAGAGAAGEDRRSIILLIEEPELYIHPQLCKLFYDVLAEFAETDQVIYTTHSPLFIDAFRYRSIAIVRKQDPAAGTKVVTCEPGALDDLSDKKQFKLLVRLDPAVNELFFARTVLVVEGQQDQIAVVGTLMATGHIMSRVEEIGLTVVVAGSKSQIPAFQRILAAFDIPCLVLHDSDLREGMKDDARRTAERENKAIEDLASPGTVFAYPVTLEASLGMGEEYHFKDTHEARELFTDPERITAEVRDLMSAIAGGVQSTKAAPRAAPEAEAVPAGG